MIYFHDGFSIYWFARGELEIWRPWFYHGYIMQHDTDRFFSVFWLLPNFALWNPLSWIFFLGSTTHGNHHPKHHPEPGLHATPKPKVSLDSRVDPAGSHRLSKWIPSRHPWRLELVGGIPTPLKNMSSSVGMMIIPNGKIKFMFQTSNQMTTGEFGGTPMTSETSWFIMLKPPTWGSLYLNLYWRSWFSEALVSLLSLWGCTHYG